MSSRRRRRLKEREDASTPSLSFSLFALPLNKTKDSPANRTSPTEASRNVRFAAKRVAWEAGGGKGRRGGGRGGRAPAAIVAVVEFEEAPPTTEEGLSPVRITRSSKTASSTTTRATVKGASAASCLRRMKKPRSPRASARATAPLLSAASLCNLAESSRWDLPEASSAGVAPVASRRARDPRALLSWAAADEREGEDEEEEEEGGGAAKLPLPSPHFAPPHQLEGAWPLHRPCSACASSTATSLQPLRAA